MGQRGKPNRFLVDRLHAYKMQRMGADERRERYERLLTYIANLKFPDEYILTFDLKGMNEEERRFFEGAVSGRKPSNEPLFGKSFEDQLREKTLRAWPEIWAVDAEPLPVIAVRRMRTYLRRCWDSQNEREGLWYVHRALENCQALHILRNLEVKTLRDLAAKALSEQDAQRFHELNQRLQSRTQDLLDQVPFPHAELEDALLHLREMASGKVKRRRPLHCPKPDCEEPYFFSRQKGEKYCLIHRTMSAEGKERIRHSKRNSYHAHKDIWPSQAKRKKQSPH